MKALDLPEIPLPAGWNASTKRALMAAFTLAHFTITAVRDWGNSTSLNSVKRDLQIEGLENENALLVEQLRILMARYAKLPASARPHYCASDRFAILALKEARG